MCGISGLFDLRGAQVAGELILRMVDAQHHRGPDDRGVFVEGAIGLGHNRLAILDLSPAGHQPMLSPDGALALVFNGEIYNYVELRERLRSLGYAFRSSSDTEVLLAAYLAWGADCVRELNGMWAFAVWDARRRELFLSRDRFGVKPLVYAKNARRFIFASEAKALLAAEPELAEPNLTAVTRFADGGVIDRDESTFFADMVTLPAAHHLVVRDDGVLRLTRYWEPPSAVDARPHGELVEEFRARFVDSVRLRLRADVPVGTCLSGGLDSSAIVCVAKKVLHHPMLHAFSSLHREAEANEQRYVEAAVRATGVSLHPVRPSPSLLRRDLAQLVWHHEKPALTASLFSQWEVMRAASGHVKVLLDGQGADELLGGYTWYFGAALIDELERGGSMGEAARALLHAPLMSLVSGDARIFAELARRLPAVGAALSALKRPAAPSILSRAVPRAPSASVELPRRFGHRLLDLLADQFLTTSLPHLLQLEDRSSMAFGVEARVPFTDDHRLVELSLSLPPTLRIAGHRTKVVLREAMRGILPEVIRRRWRKLGFPTPLASWLRRDPALALELGATDFERRGVIDGAVVRQLLAEHLSGAADHSGPLFRAWTLERWYQVFIDGKGVRPRAQG